MSTINTATLKSNEFEELDDASLQAITGGLLDGITSLVSAVSQGSSGAVAFPTPFGYGTIYGTQTSSGSASGTGLLSLLPI